jgi:WD40 repeat protein
VGTVKYSQDGRWILTAGGESAHIWDTGSFRSIATLPKDEGDLKTGAFSPDQALVATGGFGGAAAVWETKTWKRQSDLKGHEGIVFDGSFSPDSRWLLTAALDGTARLWYPRTGTVAATLFGHGAVYSAAFSPNGRSIATAEWDGTSEVYLCDICGTLPALIDLAGIRITRELTAGERANYLH